MPYIKHLCLMQVLPPPYLRNFIRHYLWIDKPTDLNSRLQIFGDGSPGIVFCCEGTLYTDSMLLDPYPVTFAYGQIDRFRHIHAPGKLTLLIAVLQPFALPVLLRTAAAELRDKFVDAEHLFGKNYRTAIPGFHEVGDLDSRLEICNRLFAGMFLNGMGSNEKLLSATIGYISRQEGLVSSAQLMKFTGYSERYLEIKFKEHIGIGPKKFARITRLLKYIKYLQASSVSTQSAYAAGYFDQAHLNHDFKALTGITPSTYLSQGHPLALNLLAFA